MYLIVVAYQSIVAAYTFLLLACVSSIAIGAHLFHLSVNADIKRNLLLTNECAKTKGNQLQMIFKELSDAIQLHSQLKQFVTLLEIGTKIKKFKIQNSVYFQMVRRFCKNLSSDFCYIFCLEYDWNMHRDVTDSNGNS